MAEIEITKIGILKIYYYDLFGRVMLDAFNLSDHFPGTKKLHPAARPHGY